MQYAEIQQNQQISYHQNMQSRQPPDMQPSRPSIGRTIAMASPIKPQAAFLPSQPMANQHQTVA